MRKTTLSELREKYPDGNRIRSTYVVIRDQFFNYGIARIEVVHDDALTIEVLVHDSIPAGTPYTVKVFEKQMICWFPTVVDLCTAVLHADEVLPGRKSPFPPGYLDVSVKY